MIFVLSNKEGEILEVSANSLAAAILIADQQGFQVWNSEVKEGEDFVAL